MDNLLRTQSIQPIWLVYGVLAIVVIILLVRFGNTLFKGVAIIGGLILAILIVDAFRQQGRAMQQTATAATVATAGQAAGSMLQTVLAILLLLVLLAGIGISLYLYVRLRRAERRTGYRQPRDARGRWISSDADAPQISYEPPMDIGQSLNILLQMELLRSMRELRAPQQTQRELAAIEGEYEYENDEEPDDDLWGW